MPRYVLDTGVLLGYIREAPFALEIEDRYSPQQPPNSALVSAVSVGEIKCFSIRGKWSDEKRAALEHLLREIPSAPINHPLVLERYAEITTFVEGRNPARPLPPKTSARSLSDNDRWIAATASVLKGTLLTLDKDFLFLDGKFLDVIYIDQGKK